LRKVIDLEHDGHCRLELNDLSTVKTKLFVIIEYCVHVFDPNGINWAIEADPFSVWAFRLSAISDFDGEDSI